MYAILLQCMHHGKNVAESHLASTGWCKPIYKTVEIVENLK